MRVPGAPLARAIADRILCAASLADGCGDEPALIAAYGTEVGELVRRHMPMLGFEHGSRAVPVDFRRCRSSECGDAAGDGLIHRTDERLPVTAFVHVVDCREGQAERAKRPASTAPASGPATSTSSTGPTTPTRRPCAECRSRARRATTPTTGRASSSASAPTAGSTSAPPLTTATTIPARTDNWIARTPALVAHDGWGPETHLLFVSGGSHAGNAAGSHADRYTPGRRVHLIPLEPIAAEDADFAVSPPGRRKSGSIPEAEGTPED